MSTKPPAVALWLLTRLVTGPNREALLGDLVEQHAHGKSSAWFWKETVAAIGASTAEASATLRRRQRYRVLRGLHVGAVLGTVKTLPGLARVDASLAASAPAGCVPLRRLTSALVFASLVGVRDVPCSTSWQWSILDHFGGLAFSRVMAWTRCQRHGLGRRLHRGRRSLGRATAKRYSGHFARRPLAAAHASARQPNIFRSAWSRSAIRSSTCSMPTASRTVLSLICARACSSAERSLPR